MDAEVLADCGFLRRSFGSRGSPLFAVTPQGIEAYETIQNATPASANVEKTLTHFLATPEFQREHPAACAKWEKAASLLWAADSAQELTTIGHLCREAMQEFGASLAARHNIDVSDIDPASTVKRLKKIISSLKSRLGQTEGAFIDAMIAYWGVVSDLIQRQEHGGQREGVTLSWEDGRRVVFQTCVVMYEVSRALAH